MSQPRVSFYAPVLLGLSLTAGSVQAANVRVPPEMSFFEYLGSMVEDDEGWVDPLQMEDPEFFTDLATEQVAEAEQHVQKEQIEQIEQKEQSEQKKQSEQKEQDEEQTAVAVDGLSELETVVEEQK